MTTMMMMIIIYNNNIIYNIIIIIRLVSYLYCCLSGKYVTLECEGEDVFSCKQRPDLSQVSLFVS